MSDNEHDVQARLEEAQVLHEQLTRVVTLLQQRKLKDDDREAADVWLKKIQNGEALNEQELEALQFLESNAPVLERTESQPETPLPANSDTDVVAEPLSEPVEAAASVVASQEAVVETAEQIDPPVEDTDSSGEILLPENLDAEDQARQLAERQRAALAANVPTETGRNPQPTPVAEESSSGGLWGFVCLLYRLYKRVDDYIVNPPVVAVLVVLVIWLIIGYRAEIDAKTELAFKLKKANEALLALLPEPVEGAPVAAPTLSASDLADKAKELLAQAAKMKAGPDKMKLIMAAEKAADDALLLEKDYALALRRRGEAKNLRQSGLGKEDLKKATDLIAETLKEAEKK